VQWLMRLWLIVQCRGGGMHCSVPIACLFCVFLCDKLHLHFMVETMYCIRVDGLTVSSCWAYPHLDRREVQWLHHQACLQFGCAAAKSSPFQAL
jgi:hypothetical protein